MPRFNGELVQPLELRSTPEAPRPSGPRFKGEPVARSSPVDVLSQFGSGFNERLANLIGAPTESVSQVMQGLGVDLPYMPESEIANAIRDYLVGPEPKTGVERVARRAGEEVGATLPYAALPYVAAAGPAVAPAARHSGGAVRQSGRALVEGVRNAPARAAAGELAATVGSGTGAGVAQEVAPGSAGAEMAGQLAGGVAPAVLANMPLALVTRIIAGTARRFPAALKQAARQEVSRAVGPHLESPQAQAGLKEAEALRQEIPGFEPSLAESTGSPSLLATQRSIEGQATGESLEALAGRRAASEEAIERFGRARAPESGEALEYVFDTAQGRISGLKGQVAAQQSRVAARQAETEAGAQAAREGATARVQGLAGRVGRQQEGVAQRQQELAEGLPVADRSQIGENLRGQLIQERQRARTEMSRLAQRLGINDADVSVNFGELQAKLKAEMEPASLIPQRAEDRPKVLDEILAIMPEGGANQPKITFQDYMELRHRVSDDLMDALSSATPNRRKIRDLVRIKHFLDDEMVPLFDELDQTLGQNAKQFREAYRTRYIDRFEKGAAFKVRQEDGRGYYRTPDEKVADAFFQKGNVSAARQFKAAFGDNAAAQADLEAAALDALRDYSVRDGRVDPKRLQTWLREHRSVLDEFPALKAKVQDVDQAANALAARQAQLERRGKVIQDTLLKRELERINVETDATLARLKQRQAQIEARGQSIENTALGREIARLEQLKKTPEQSLQAALNDPRLMQRLMNGLRGKEDAKQALRRAVWDQGLDSNDLAGYLDSYERSLRIALGDEHMKNLRTIARAQAMLNRTQAPQGKAFQPDPVGALSRQLGTGVPQLASRFYAFKSGRLPRDYLLAEAGSRIFRGRSILRSQELLTEALYNPEVAKDLADIAVNNRVKAEIANRLNVRLFNLGLTSREEAMQPEATPQERPVGPQSRREIPAGVRPGAAFVPSAGIRG